MSVLKRRLVSKVPENKIVDLFIVNEGKLTLTDRVLDFLLNNITSVVRNVTLDETQGIAIVHYVLDRVELESFLNVSIDDATCKIIIKCINGDRNLMDSLIEIIKNRVMTTLNQTLNVRDFDLEYGDGVFHVIVVLY